MLISNTTYYVWPTFLFWNFITSIIQKTTNKKMDYVSRVYSSIHAFISSFNSASYLLGYSSLNTFQTGMSFTVSYAFHDILYLIRRPKTDYAMIVHHALLILGNIPYLIPSFHEGIYSKFDYGIAVLFLAEISTIFLNNSWFLFKNNNTKSWHFKFNVYATLTTYVVFRIITYTYINYMCYLDRYYTFMPFSLCITSFNYYWFYKLLKKRTEVN